MQQGFDDPKWGNRNNPDAEGNVSNLISFWRRVQGPVIHVQHCSLEPGSPLGAERAGCQFKPEAAPIEGEPIFKKTVNSAFIGTNLESYLRENGFESIVIAGLTTDHCVSTSTRMAGNLGFNVTLVSDATATFDRIGHNGTGYSADEIHEIHLASLNDEFCAVRSTGEVLNNFGK